MRYEIVKCRQEHLMAITPHLRADDLGEETATRVAPRHLLSSLWRDSFRRCAALVEGEIAAVWGFSGQLLSSEVNAWLFTSPAIEKAPLAFFREARAEIAAALQGRHAVVSECAASCVQALRFYDLLGFDIGALQDRPDGAVREIRFSREVSRRSTRTRRDTRPFVIFALGRSRTAWLSAFLTYREWTCYHEHSVRLRSIEEARRLVNMPCTGTAETAAAPGWHLVRQMSPRAKFVVVRRDVDEAIRAMCVAYDRGGLPYDPNKLRSIFEREARDLERISALPGTLTLDYEDLSTEAGCREIFEFCLPFEFDRTWWEALKDRRIEVSLAPFLRYYWTNRDSVEGFKNACRRELRRLVRSGEIAHAIN